MMQTRLKKKITILVVNKLNLYGNAKLILLYLMELFYNLKYDFTFMTSSLKKRKYCLKKKIIISSHFFVFLYIMDVWLCVLLVKS